MFETLAAEIGAFEVSSEAESLIELLRIRDRFEARVSEAIDAVAVTGMWDLSGRTSMTSWVAHHARMTSSEAHRLVKTAQRLRDLPATKQAWDDGELSGGQVATVLAGVRREHRELYAEHEADLVPKLAQLNLPDTRRAINHWTTLAEAQIDPALGEEPESYLRASRVLGDRVAVDGDLDADTGELLLTALRVAETPDPPGLRRAATTRRADALADICRFFLNNQAARPGARHRPHVNVVVEADDLYAARRASYLGGTSLSHTTASEVLCDANMHRMVVAPDSTILDYGRATRTISAALWAAVVVRDDGCRFPGCDRPPIWCEAHHAIWFSEGGTTDPTNIFLACSRHHHVLHRPGWSAKLLPDGTVEVTDRWGQIHTSSPPRTLRLC